MLLLWELELSIWRLYFAIFCFILLLLHQFYHLLIAGTWGLLLLTLLLLPNATWVLCIDTRRGNSLHNWSTCSSFMKGLRLMIMMGHNWQMMRCFNLIMIASNLSSYLPLKRFLRSVYKQSYTETDLKGVSAFLFRVFLHRLMLMFWFFSLPVVLIVARACIG